MNDRPWALGEIIMVADTGAVPCVVEIICYLDEEDPIASARVVYFDFETGLFFDEEVARVEKFGWCYIRMVWKELWS